MDIKKLKDQSDLAHNISIEKKNALEKMRSRQTLVYNNQIFKANSETITLVKTLLEQRPNQEIYIIDTNSNPCEIKDSKDFLDKLIQRNQESINEYHRFYSRFKRR